MRAPVLSLLLAPLAPERLQACAVCFTSDNPSIGRAYSLGVFILMGFTFLILGALAFAVHRVEARRAAMAAAQRGLSS